MERTLKQFKTRTLSKPEVRAAYDQFADEFAFLDEVLKALGFKVDIRLVPVTGPTRRSSGRAKSGARRST